MGESKFIIIDTREESYEAGEYTYDEIHERFKNLVKKEASNYLKYGNSKFSEKWASMIEYDDLFSAGCVGLLSAYNNYNADREVSFSHYVRFCIKGGIRRYFRDLTQGRRKDSNNKDCMLFAYSYNEVMRNNRGDEECEYLETIVDDKNSSIEDTAINNKMLTDALECLKLKDKKAYDAFLGLYSGYSQQELTGKLNVSQAQVSRLNTRAKKFLKEHINMEGKDMATESKVNKKSMLKFFKTYGISKETMKKYCEITGATMSTIVAYISRGGYRKEVFPPYKPLSELNEDDYKFNPNETQEKSITPEPKPNQQATKPAGTMSANTFIDLAEKYSKQAKAKQDSTVVSKDVTNKNTSYTKAVEANIAPVQTATSNTKSVVSDEKVSILPKGMMLKQIMLQGSGDKVYKVDLDKQVVYVDIISLGIENLCVSTDALKDLAKDLKGISEMVEGMKNEE